MQKFPPSGIRKGIDFVKYLWNGSTPRRDRWTRSVVTVERAAITARVARRILTPWQNARQQNLLTWNNLELGPGGRPNSFWGADLALKVRGFVCRRTLNGKRFSLRSPAASISA